MKEISEYYKEFKNKKIKEINILYFHSLYEKFVSKQFIEMTLNQPGKNESKVVPFPITDDDDLKVVIIQDYEKLHSKISSKLKEFELCICKMQAGLGTSVERNDLLEKYTKRKSLGSKGTDLFIEYLGRTLSIAEVQLLLAQKKKNENIFKSVSILNLINSETENAVNDIWSNKHPLENLTYNEIFNNKELSRKNEISQLMMPTIDETEKISFDRMAPAGHAFLGFYEILETFRGKEINNELLVIGNGEDLRSTPDNKILSWVAENEVPIVMITTTKLEKDKKGGQLALVKENVPFVTIVEKAQAQRANQLEYFEEIGLREGDKKSLFNTNIVIINKKALKEKFDENLDLSEEDFVRIISPDLIKNIKEQSGKKFIQLEGAIGSTILNLDKFFRQTYEKPLVHFLNLSPENREKFFMPIKKRQDFEDIYNS